MGWGVSAVGSCFGQSLVLGAGVDGGGGDVVGSYDAFQIRLVLRDQLTPLTIAFHLLLSWPLSLL